MSLRTFGHIYKEYMIYLPINSAKPPNISSVVNAKLETFIIHDAPKLITSMMIFFKWNIPKLSQIANTMTDVRR